jgi:hypothetical protein
MTPLRAKYIRDLVIHGRSKNTQEAYTRYVCDLARYYRRSPELISYGEVTGWLYYLITERQGTRSAVSDRLLKELVNYWRAQRQGKAAGKAWVKRVMTVRGSFSAKKLVNR